MNIARRRREKKLDPLKQNYSLFIMDNKIEIEKNDIEIEDNFIRFRSKMPIINFASHWGMCNYKHQWLEHKTTNIRGYGNIPPIQYSVEEDKYHLKIELFQKVFVRKRETSIKEYFVVPKEEYLEEELDSPEAEGECRYFSGEEEEEEE